MSDEVDDFLAHYGVPGMKWGKTKARPDGTSRRTERDAGKDAKEFARAKMYYGQGAGVRRRLIKGTVESKSKDSSYKESFDRQLATQNMAKAAESARGKRKRTDTVQGAAKTTRGVVNVIKGNAQFASAASIILVGAAGAAHKSGVDKMIFDYGKRTVTSIINDPKTQNIKNLWGK